MKVFFCTTLLFFENVQHPTIYFETLFRKSYKRTTGLSLVETERKTEHKNESISQFIVLFFWDSLEKYTQMCENILNRLEKAF